MFSIKPEHEKQLMRALRAHPGESGFIIRRCAGIGVYRATVLLARWEHDGIVRSYWADEPHPRRRLYILVNPLDAT